MITYERLIELLDYDPDTGLFVWKDSRKGYVSGKVAGWETKSGKCIMIDGKEYRYNRLVHLYIYGIHLDGYAKYLDGNKNNTKLSNLEFIYSKNNGERHSNSGMFMSSHKDAESYEYGIWGNMLYRCNTKTSHLYDNYGGRGIKVSEEWNSYENFISDMGRRPSDKHSIDRINPDGDYCKENCRWATPKQQARNRRNSVMITYRGETLQVDDMCEKYGLSKSLVKQRLRRGWTNERAIEQKPKKSR